MATIDSATARDEARAAILRVVAQVRAAAHEAFGWTHLDLDGDGERGYIVLRGTTLTHSLVDQVVRVISAADRDAAIDCSRVTLWRTGSFYALAPGRTALWRHHRDRGAYELVTQLRPGDGPVEVMRSDPACTLVRAPDGTLGWAFESLGPSVGAPRLCETSLSGPGDRERLPSLARMWRNVPYRLGGTSMDGVDCSGLAQRLLGELGVPLPRHSYDQLSVAPAEGLGPDEPGTIIAVWGDQEAPCHIGIGLGAGAIIHASASRRRVVIEPAAHLVGSASHVMHVPWGALCRLAEGARGHRNLIDVLDIGRGIRRSPPGP